jgi:hypothetical protein
LLVTAIHFFDLETAILSGRSPRGKLLPAGDKLHPLGRRAFELTFPGFVICELDTNALHSISARRKFLMGQN